MLIKEFHYTYKMCLEIQFKPSTKKKFRRRKQRWLPQRGKGRRSSGLGGNPQDWGWSSGFGGNPQGWGVICSRFYGIFYWEFKKWKFWARHTQLPCIVEKKIFLYYARECKENDVINITSPRFTLLIRDNNYETAITYMNPRCKLLVRVDDYWSAEKNKMLKIDLK